MNLKFNSLEEFADLYNRSVEEAFKSFHSSEFIAWLKEKQYKKESELYKSCKLNSAPRVALQNFLQLQDLDVIPILQAKVVEDVLILKNIGKGHLYGWIQCNKGVDTDFSDWSVPEKEIRILCRGSGSVDVFSNGGYEQLTVASYQRLALPIERYDIDVDLSGIFQKRAKVENFFDMPKIIKDNAYVDRYCDEENNIRIEKKASYLMLLKRKRRGIISMTTVKLIYLDKIVHIKIKVS